MKGWTLPQQVSARVPTRQARVPAPSHIKRAQRWRASVPFVLLAIVSMAGCAHRNGDLLSRAPVPSTPRRIAAYASNEQREAGAKLFRRECAACHGEYGEGGRKAPSLAVPRIRYADPETLLWILKNGDLRSGMPSFAGMPRERREQIVMYLQSMESEEVATGSVRAVP
jgi:mono/diheme cytochrome c family protein